MLEAADVQQHACAAVQHALSRLQQHCKGCLPWSSASVHGGPCMKTDDRLHGEAAGRQTDLPEVLPAAEPLTGQ
jgi:hypothetical protein